MKKTSLKSGLME